MPSNEGPSELTEIAREGLVDTLLGAAEYGFAESFYAATDYPGFVADNSPTAPHLAFGKAVTRQACRRWARGGGPGNLPGFNAAWGAICGPYLDSLGENPGDGSLGLPFEGGQCEIIYIVDVQIELFPFSDCSTFGPGNSANGYIGPIRGLRFATENPSGELCTPRGNVVYLQHGPPGNETLLGGAGYGVEASIVSITPSGGVPDNCGNPPPVYEPPGIPTGLPGLPPIVVNVPGIGPVTVDVDFDPDGNIDVELPDVGIDFTIEDPFGFGGDDEPPAGGGDGPPPGDVGEPGGGVEPGPGGDAEGVAPEGSVLVGLRVQILEAPESRARYTDTVLRGAYYVYMGVPGLLDHDPAGAMVTSDQFIFAEKENLTAWRVSANNGYSLRVTPYYRQVEG